MTLYKIEQGLKDVLTDVQLENSVLIQPSYFKDLVKLVAVIIGEANNMKEVLHCMEIMQHEIVLEQKLNYNQRMGSGYSSIAHKLAKDIVIFYLKVNKMDLNFFEDIFNA